MRNSLEREMAISRRDKDIATETSQQAHYILWTRIMDIKDPCGNEPGYDIIVGLCVGFLQYGVNYTNKDGIRATTMAGYAKAVDNLFTLRGFTAPVDLSDPENYTGLKIMNHQKEEDIAVQRYPLTRKSQRN